MSMDKPRIVNLRRMAPRRFADLVGSINFSDRAYYDPREKIGVVSDCTCGECCRARARVPNARLPTIDEVIVHMKQRLRRLA